MNKEKQQQKEMFDIACAKFMYIGQPINMDFHGTYAHAGKEFTYFELDKLREEFTMHLNDGELVLFN